MPTISGIFKRNFTISNAEPIKTLIGMCYRLGVIGFSILWRKSPEIKERHIGVLSMMSILLLPYAHHRDLILLLIPIFCLIQIYLIEGMVHQNFLVLMPLIVSWLSVLGFAGSGLLKFPIVYTVMFILGYLFIKAGRTPYTMSRRLPEFSRRHS